MNIDKKKIDEIITVNNGQYHPKVLEAIDCYLASESWKYEYVSLEKKPGLYIYNGNIFDLPVDVIVNPINEYGLGCFQVGHNCLDNQIHRRCGPKLREECRNVLQGRIIKPGEVFATKAYNTEFKYIFHALGPQFSHRDDTALLNCYVNSLKLMDKYSVKSIAFPEISCGVYGYPKKIARGISHNIDPGDKIVYLVERD